MAKAIMCSIAVVALIGVVAVGIYSMKDQTKEPSTPAAPVVPKDVPEGSAVATFAGGCFWCTEAVFLELKGVQGVVSGYIGGHTAKPTYKDICTGTTGHAEAIQITYNPAVVNFDELLEVFFKTHDPTTLNRQGPDTGTQYRSSVFYHSDEQKKSAEYYKKKLDDAGVFGSPIVTEIVPATEFFPAEDYHQNYFANNPSSGYCQVMIGPKLRKLQQVFGSKLKSAK